jgi:hypothetical protein
MFARAIHSRQDQDLCPPPSEHARKLAARWRQPLEVNHPLSPPFVPCNTNQRWRLGVAFLEPFSWSNFLSLIILILGNLTMSIKEVTTSAHPLFVL